MTDPTRAHCARCEELRADLIQRAAIGDDPEMGLHDWVSYLDERRKLAQRQVEEFKRERDKARARCEELEAALREARWCVDFTGRYYAIYRSPPGGSACKELLDRIDVLDAKGHDDDE